MLPGPSRELVAVAAETGDIPGGLAQVVPVFVTRLVPRGTPSVREHDGGWTWTRDRDLAYEPDIAPGESGLEVAIIEPEWGGRGHRREWPVIREQVRGPVEAAKIVASWSRYPREFAAMVPSVDETSPPEGLERREMCIWLLDRGRIEEALALYSIDLDRELARLLHGQPIHYELKELTRVWTDRLRSTLAKSSPWTVAEVLKGTGVDSKGRAKPVRLFGLGAMKQVRKPSVLLVSSHARLCLELRFSGAAQKVDASAWTRQGVGRLKRINRLRVP
jgi:hypothetical protein